MGEVGCSVGVPTLKGQFILLALCKLRIARAVRDVMCMVYYVQCTLCIVTRYSIHCAMGSVQCATGSGKGVEGLGRAGAEVLGEKSLGK